MQRAILTTWLGAVLCAASPALPAQSESGDGPTFAQAAQGARRQLEDSLAELADLRARMAEEQLPLSRNLSELERQLSALRTQYQATTRALDGRTLDLGNLRREIEQRRQEASYLSDRFGEYGRNFESRLHIAELQRYAAVLEQVELAPDDPTLSEQELRAVQAGLLAVSLERLEDAAGGTSFLGTAVDPGGIVDPGRFVLVGPVALFASQDGSDVGTAEQRLGSLEPTVISFAEPEQAATAKQLVTTGKGLLVLDPTLGNAHKIAATEQESLLQEVEKGGVVMWPIFILAATALLVAVFKWLSMALVRKPSRKKVRALLDAVRARDEAAVKQRVAVIRGPAGRMLAAGVEHIREPRELIEEVMFETVLTTRLKLQRMLPFIAICAASAPLLGLLGTVTGIISTFKLITVFGSGDVKMLSGGISEALITTKYGLIVAIPSLLIHGFLARKARGVIGHMEATAVAFANEVAVAGFAPERTPRRDPMRDETGDPRDDDRDDAGRGGKPHHAPAAQGDTEGLRAQVKEILSEMLVPMVRQKTLQPQSPPRPQQPAHAVQAGNGGHQANQATGQPA